MGPQVQQNPKKSQLQKWEKSSSKNKTDMNKSIEFLVKINVCFGFHRQLAEKKHQIYGKNLCFLHQLKQNISLK